MNIVRLAIMTIRIVMRTKVALFFTFLFPCIFLFIYAGIFAHGNPNTVAYMFGQVLTLNILGAGFFGLGLQAVMQRERGVLRRYRLAPISSLTIVTSNLLANYLIQIPVVALLVACAMGIFHMPLKLSLLPMLWLLVTVGIFAFAGFGLTLASVSNTMQEVQVYNNLAWFALVFLSGITIPLPILPHWIQTVATFLPATYLVSTFQAVMSNSESISAHLPEMVALIVSGFAGLFIAWKLFRWEKDERIPTSSKLWALALLIPVVLMGIWMNIFANPTASWAKSYALMIPPTTGSGGTPGNASGKVLVDFESPGAAQKISQPWKISSDLASAASPAAPEAAVSLVSPGANGTQHALRFHGHLGGMGEARGFAETRAGLTLPAAIKDFHGIEFWIRSDDTRTYQITVAGTGSDPGTTPEIRLTPAHDWESVRIPAPQLSGTQTSSPQAAPFVFAIKTSGPTGDFQVDIDEIQCY